MLLPPPIVVVLDDAASPLTSPSMMPLLTPQTAWTSYLTPKATWKVDALPVTVGFGGAGLAGLDVDPVSLLQVAMNPWQSVDCTLLRLKAQPSTTVLGSEAEDGKNDVLVHTTEWPSTFTVGAAGQTVIYVRGADVVEADIHLNARDYAFVLGDAPGKIDLQSVLTHELGHVIGVGHTDVARATMNAGLGSGIGARSLERDDLDAVCALYPGANASAGCASSGCPAGFSCVGRTCQRAGERGVAGHACADGARPCEGAGDAAECVTTSAGALCAIPCAPAAAGYCGVGMACVAAVDGTYCLPEGAIPRADAGPIVTDAGSTDAGAPGGGGEGPGCSCGTAPAPRGFGWVAAALLCARRRRTRGGAR